MKFKIKCKKLFELLFLDRNELIFNQIGLRLLRHIGHTLK
jgi:hypothetical protein